MLRMCTIGRLMAALDVNGRLVMVVGGGMPQRRVHMALVLVNLQSASGAAVVVVGAVVWVGSPSFLFCHVRLHLAPGTPETPLARPVAGCADASAT